MFRRPIVNSSPQPATYEADYEVVAGELAPGKAADSRVLAPDGAAPVAAGWSGPSASWYGSSCP
jgi:hypothetical protein